MSQYKTAIRYGIISGMAIVGVHLAMYALQQEWLVSTWFYYSIFLIHAWAMVAAGLAFRSRHQDRADFREVLREAFITFLIGMLLYYACYYAMFSMDEGLIALQKEQAYGQILWLRDHAGIEERQVEQMLERWKTDDYRVSLWDVWAGLPFRAMAGFVLSALIAWMVRR